MVIGAVCLSSEIGAWVMAIIRAPEDPNIINSIRQAWGINLNRAHSKPVFVWRDGITAQNEHVAS